MSYEDVINYLKRKKDFLSVREISEELATPNKSNIAKHLKDAVFHKNILVKETKMGRFRTIKKYKWVND